MLGYSDIIQAYENVIKYKNPTSLQYSGTLSRIINNKIYLKPENLQFTGSFKLGGAMNVMAKMAKKKSNNGVVTCSAGNWAQAVAYAAQIFKSRSVIVMPGNASAVKIEATKSYGAEVVLFGKDSNDVTAKANEIANREGLTFLSPFDDERVIAGHGVVGLDIFEEKPDTEVIICPVGSGAFISGILLALKETDPGIKIIGVEPLNSNAMWLSLQANRVVEKESIDTIADGLALKKPGKLPFQIVKKYLDDIVLVNEDEIKRGVLLLLERAKLLVEPSGAVTIAALMTGKIDIKNKEIVAILSGGNIELDKLADFIKK